MPAFEPGAKVRVRSGVTVPDFEDIPLGGWNGTIKESEQFEDQIDYEIEWDRRTLDGMHPVYRKRCERDGLDLESMWLGEEDLEADDGTPVPIEQPTRIVTPPLSEKDQDDRVRMALGLTHDDPLPEITLEALLAYHRYLTANLKFPFTAYCGEEVVGPFSRRRATMTVTGLRESLGVEDGLVCQGRVREDETGFPLAEIEVGKKNPNSRLLSDYAYWFHNWPCQDDGGIDREDDSWPGVTSWTETAHRDESDLDGEDADREGASEIPPPGPWIWGVATVVFGVVGGLVGATNGAALGTLDGAGLAAMIGGVPLGMLGAFLLGRYGFFFGAVNRLRFGAFLGAVLGLLGGGLVGVVAGLTVVALPWSLLGLIAGMFSGPFLLPQKRRRLVSLRAAALGTCVGVLISAFRHDRARAIAGAVSGSITGLVVAAGLILLLVGFVYLIPRTPMGYDGEEDEFEDVDEEGEDQGGLRLRRS
jgi:Calcium binding